MKKLLSAALAALCAFAFVFPAVAQVPVAYQAQSSNRTVVVPVTTANPLPATISGALPAGTSLLGSVNLSAATSGGCTPYGAQSAASTNSTSVKASAGTLCGGVVINTTATLYYLRLYDSASAPTCSSATNFIATIPIPASTSGNGTLIGTGTFGAAFANGIAFCLTGGGTSTDNTSAAVGVFAFLTYK